MRFVAEKSVLRRAVRLYRRAAACFRRKCSGIWSWLRKAGVSCGAVLSHRMRHGGGAQMRRTARGMTAVTAAVLVCLTAFSAHCAMSGMSRAAGPAAEGSAEGEADPPRCTGADAEEQNAEEKRTEQETDASPSAGNLTAEEEVETVKRFDAAAEEAGHAGTSPEIAYDKPAHQRFTPSVSGYGETIVLPEEERPDKQELLSLIGEWRKKQFHVYEDIPLTQEQQQLVFRIAGEYGLQAELIYGIMYTETRYTVNIKSGDGRNYGIMQINTVNFPMLRKAIGVSDFLDFESNVRSGAYILSLLARNYSDEAKILMCYNRGEAGAIAQWKNGNTYDRYCASVLGEMNRLLEQR